MTDLVWTAGSEPPRFTILLAHGAGAGHDSAFMQRMAEALAAEGAAVCRFDFPYMAERRTTGRRRPPPKAETLVDAYAAVLEAALARPEAAGPVLVAGKSMGGRVAAMLAGRPLDPRVVGVACLGYPFHPPGQPDALRLAPLREARLPVLVLQGERDEFGTYAEAGAIGLPAAVRLVAVEDGSHDFGPRGQSPATLKGNIRAAAAEIAAFAGAPSHGPAAKAEDPTEP
ncbi:alpha/beta fold hydrolase [Prosthecomicrobium sp. N25]|uniref:alpha/beta fold hydrolase n=1 Tax=Prosthecomicrobium sp. N25 TaxID=3129254 RepID=UPI003077DD5C